MRFCSENASNGFYFSYTKAPPIQTCSMFVYSFCDYVAVVDVEQA